MLRVLRLEQLNIMLEEILKTIDRELWRRHGEFRQYLRMLDLDLQLPPSPQRRRKKILN